MRPSAGDQYSILSNAWVRVDSILDHLDRALHVVADRLEQGTEYDEYGRADEDERLAPIYDLLSQLDTLRGLAQARKIADAAAVLEDILSSADDCGLGMDIATALSDLDEQLTILQATHYELLYVPQRPLIEAPRILVALSDDLLRAIAKSPSLLYSIAPREFEVLVAEIFSRRGFEVELTQATRDGGKDIIAINRILGIPTKYIIECKRYAKDQTVGLALVQRLLGVKVATGANKAILATTTSFTRDARALEAQMVWDLSLKDYDAITAWVRETGRSSARR